jgi:hypothetical protein
MPRAKKPPASRKAKRDAETFAEAMAPVSLYDAPEPEEIIDWESELPRVIATSDEVNDAAKTILLRTLEGKLSTGQAQAATPLLALISRNVNAKEDRQHKVAMLKMQSGDGEGGGLPPDPFVTRTRTVIATQEVEYGTPQRLPDPPMRPIFSRPDSQPLFSPVKPERE